ncbi:MAG: FtsX-like permease family protein, partial [Terracidiphilus sp.]
PTTLTESVILARLGVRFLSEFPGLGRYDAIIRTHVGANRSQIFRLILHQVLRMAGAGLGVGVLAAIALVRLLPSFSHLLYGVGQTDPFTLLCVSAVLLLAAAIACYLPARRAMRTDPMECLRTE